MQFMLVIHHVGYNLIYLSFEHFLRDIKAPAARNIKVVVRVRATVTTLKVKSQKKALHQIFMGLLTQHDMA